MIYFYLMFDNLWFFIAWLLNLKYFFITPFWTINTHQNVAQPTILTQIVIPSKIWWDKKALQLYTIKVRTLLLTTPNSSLQITAFCQIMHLGLFFALRSHWFFFSSFSLSITFIQYFKCQYIFIYILIHRFAKHQFNT